MKASVNLWCWTAFKARSTSYTYVSRLMVDFQLQSAVLTVFWGCWRIVGLSCATRQFLQCTPTAVRRQCSWIETRTDNWDVHLQAYYLQELEPVDICSIGDGMAVRILNECDTGPAHGTERQPSMLRGSFYIPGITTSDRTRSKWLLESRNSAKAS